MTALEILKVIGTGLFALGAVTVTMVLVCAWMARVVFPLMTWVSGTGPKRYK